MSSDLLAAELVRPGADFTFLRRSFTADMAGRDPFVEVPRLLEAVARLAPRRRAAGREVAFVAAVTGASTAVTGRCRGGPARVRALVTGAGGSSAGTWSPGCAPTAGTSSG